MEQSVSVVGQCLLVISAINSVLIGASGATLRWWWSCLHWQWGHYDVSSVWFNMIVITINISLIIGNYNYCQFRQAFAFDIKLRQLDDGVCTTVDRRDELGCRAMHPLAQFSSFLGLLFILISIMARLSAVQCLVMIAIALGQWHSDCFNCYAASNDSDRQNWELRVEKSSIVQQPEPFACLGIFAPLTATTSPTA